MKDVIGTTALYGPALHDPDMDPVRDDPRFQKLFADAEARSAIRKTD